MKSVERRPIIAWLSSSLKSKACSIKLLAFALIFPKTFLYINFILPSCLCSTYIDEIEWPIIEVLDKELSKLPLPKNNLIFFRASS